MTSNWEARARDLLTDAKNADCIERVIAGKPSEWSIVDGIVRAMLRLGREMADEARYDQHELGNKYLESLLPTVRQRAADERAKEIAQKIEARPEVGMWHRSGLDIAAAIARSTITEPEEPNCSTCGATSRDDPRGLVCSNGFHGPQDEAAIRADEREKVAHEIDGIVTATKHADAHTVKREAVRIARGTKPKTREQVLEEALRRVVEQHEFHGVACRCVCCDGRRALEWKP